MIWSFLKPLVLPGDCYVNGSERGYGDGAYSNRLGRYGTGNGDGLGHGTDEDEGPYGRGWGKGHAYGSGSGILYDDQE